MAGLGKMGVDTFGFGCWLLRWGAGFVVFGMLR